MGIFKVLVVNRGYPPLWKIFFSAYLHELGHVKKQKKSWENEESLSCPPSLCWENSQLFFFSNEPFPNLGTMFYSDSLTCEHFDSDQMAF